MDMYHLQFPLNVWIWGYFKGFSKKVILKVILKVQAIFDAVVTIINTAWKVFKYGVISCPYFPVFGLNTEIYFVNSRIQSEYRKIRTRNNSVFGDFSRIVAVKYVREAVKRNHTDMKKIITNAPLCVLVCHSIQHIAT